MNPRERKMCGLSVHSAVTPQPTIMRYMLYWTEMFLMSFPKVPAGGYSQERKIIERLAAQTNGRRTAGGGGDRSPGSRKG